MGKRVDFMCISPQFLKSYYRRVYSGLRMPSRGYHIQAPGFRDGADGKAFSQGYIAIEQQSQDTSSRPPLASRPRCLSPSDHILPPHRACATRSTGHSSPPCLRREFQNSPDKHCWQATMCRALCWAPKEPRKSRLVAKRNRSLDNSPAEVHRKERSHDNSHQAKSRDTSVPAFHCLLCQWVFSS